MFETLSFHSIFFFSGALRPGGLFADFFRFAGLKVLGHLCGINELATLTIKSFGGPSSNHNFLNCGGHRVFSLTYELQETET